MEVPESTCLISVGIKLISVGIELISSGFAAGLFREMRCVSCFKINRFGI